MEKKILTTSFGIPVDDNRNSLTAGPRGPLLLQDAVFLNKIQKFDRERIPERAAHAQGMGAHGYFEVTHDVSRYTKAKFLSEVGKRTKLFARLSTTMGSKESSDLLRDVRGFAIKFYTEDGNYDMLGIHTPVFFIRDPMQAPDMFHSQKRHPIKGHYDYNTYWDFISNVPESIHCATMIMSDRGIPMTFRHMHGYGAHTFKWVNHNGEAFFVKYTLKTDQGIKTLTDDEQKKLMGVDPLHCCKDLYESIDKGDFPSWTFYIQIMPENEALNYKWDILDITKVWPHADYPLIQIGKLVLNENNKSFHGEVEQVAFNPANMVPGIEPTNDKLLQGRLFLYQDTQLHRLGANHDQIPINCPLRMNNFQVDGQMNVINNQQKAHTYFESVKQNEGPIPDPSSRIKSFKMEGEVGRFESAYNNDDFEQVRTLYKKVLSETDRDHLIYNICVTLGQCEPSVQQNTLKLFYKVDQDYGHRISKGLGLASKGLLSDMLAGMGLQQKQIKSKPMEETREMTESK